VLREKDDGCVGSIISATSVLFVDSGIIFYLFATCVFFFTRIIKHSQALLLDSTTLK